MMLSLDTAYRSFGGEVEASSTPTICRLSDSRRHQLSAIALHSPASTKPFAAPTKPFLCLGEEVLKPGSAPLITNLIRQRSAIMWASILNSIYREFLRTTLSGMHRLAA